MDPDLIVECNGEAFAVLIQSDPDGPYLVPPIVLGVEGLPLNGMDVLAAVVRGGVTIEHPVVYGATSGDLADVNRQMAEISEAMGVPIGPPDL